MFAGRISRSSRSDRLLQHFSRDCPPDSAAVSSLHAFYYWVASGDVAIESAFMHGSGSPQAFFNGSPRPRHDLVLPLLPPELVGLAVACSEAEHVERAGRVHLELSEGKRVRTEILGHGREAATRHQSGGKDLPVPRTEFQRSRGELHHKRVAILLDGDLADSRIGEAAG
jgi:hypothetical protein